MAYFDAKVHGLESLAAVQETTIFNLRAQLKNDALLSDAPLDASVVVGTAGGDKTSPSVTVADALGNSACSSDGKGKSEHNQREIWPGARDVRPLQPSPAALVVAAAANLQRVSADIAERAIRR